MKKERGEKRREKMHQGCRDPNGSSGILQVLLQVMYL